MPLLQNSGFIGFFSKLFSRAEETQNESWASAREGTDPSMRLVPPTPDSCSYRNGNAISNSVIAASFGYGPVTPVILNPIRS